MFKNFNEVLDCEINQPETTNEPTTEQPTEPVTEPVTEPSTELQTEPTTNPTISPYQFDLNAIAFENFVEVLMEYVTGPGAIGTYVAEHGPTIMVSGSCYPDYDWGVDWNHMNCSTAFDFGYCDGPLYLSLLTADQLEDGSWVTLRHCPVCGCTTTNVPDFNYLAAEDTYRKPVDETDFFEQIDELLI